MSFTITDKDEDSLESKDTLLLVGDINEGSCSRVIRYLLEKEMLAKKPDHVKLIINSCGGFLNDNFAMIDIMNSVSYPIYTYGLGQVYSCGLFLFMAGAKGHRHLFPNTSILSHQWSGGSEGKQHEREASEKEDRHVSKRLIKHYINCTGLDKEKIIKELLPPSDVYMTAKEAIKFGLADNIVKKF